jgi:hypothetical protein
MSKKAVFIESLQQQ